MVDDVEEEIDIRLVDDAKLDEEFRKVEKAEDLAVRLEKASKKIKESDIALPKGQGAPTDLARDKQGNLTKAFQKDEETHKMLMKLQETQESLTNKIDQFDDQLDNVTDKLQEISGIARDPISFIMRFAMRKAGPFVKIAAAVMAVKLVYDSILDFIKEMYKPGQALDIRKQVLDSAKSIPQLAAIINMKHGKVFFTGDTRISQHPAQHSNTEKLIDGHLRYQYMILGNRLGDTP